jgi:murein DD-endopeptidase MepM/ murein hydrolase activator NlpD
VSRRLLVLGLGFVLVLLLAGCGGAGDTEGGESEATSIDSSTSTSTAPTTTETAAPPTTVAAAPTYAFPVDPPSAADYGPGHGGGYPATDIFCAPGTRFMAVTSGVVFDLSTTDQWNPAVDDPSTRSGIFISVVGDDGVRYHGSHLTTIAAGIELGTRVTTGQLLGTTGTTGNAAGRPSHVHFGVSRPTVPGDWEVRRGEVDTYPLLVAWEQGQALTPTLPAG